MAAAQQQTLYRIPQYCWKYVKSQATNQANGNRTCLTYMCGDCCHASWGAGRGTSTKSAPLYRHWGSVQAVRPIGRSRGIALRFHNHSTRRGWGVSVTPLRLFTSGKDPLPIVQEAGWAPGPVWTGAENLAPTGVRSLDRPTRSQSLYPLRYPASDGGTVPK